MMMVYAPKSEDTLVAIRVRDQNLNEVQIQQDIMIYGSQIYRYLYFIIFGSHKIICGKIIQIAKPIA